MPREFLAQRVAQTMRQAMAAPLVSRTKVQAPAWLEAVELIPPTETVTRTVARPHEVLPSQQHNIRRYPGASARRLMRKPRNIYRPPPIVYEEDALRTTFFRDHPWELARPRVVVEMDGNDAQHYDWSKGLYQPGLPLCGESVVQRQLWLMRQRKMTRKDAYDVARKEFYALRQQEEIERRVAVEEARMMGAYFSKSITQYSMDMEDKSYEKWKAWAASEAARLEAERSQAYTSFGTDDAAAEEDEAAVLEAPQQQEAAAPA